MVLHSRLCKFFGVYSPILPYALIDVDRAYRPGPGRRFVITRSKRQAMQS